MSDFIQRNSTTCSFTTNSSWVVLSQIEMSIKNKIESVGTPLKDWDIQIYRGILTGLNEAFIISSNKRAEILNNCSTEEERNRTDEVIRPILRGRDIGRYVYNWKELYIINFHNGLPEKNMPALKIENYPALKRHFDLFFPKLQKREDQGITPYNLRSCAYWDDFSKDKIIYSDISQELSFCISANGEFINNTAYYIQGLENKLLKYITVILNSSLMNWYYRTLSVQLGGKGVRLFSIYVNALPIPANPSDETLKLYIDFYNKMISSVQDDKEMLTKAINETVCKLYSLTMEETTFILNN